LFRHNLRVVGGIALFCLLENEDKTKALKLSCVYRIAAFHFRIGREEGRRRKCRNHFFHSLPLPALSSRSVPDIRIPLALLTASKPGL
jgi:hypothetical protein